MWTDDEGKWKKIHSEQTHTVRKLKIELLIFYLIQAQRGNWKHDWMKTNAVYEKYNF